MDDPEVVVRLTVPEAVVLDAMLRRYSETDRLDIADQAEQRALWNLQCVFEKLGDPSWPSLEEARAMLRRSRGVRLISEPPACGVSSFHDQPQQPVCSLRHFSLECTHP